MSDTGTITMPLSTALEKAYSFVQQGDPDTAMRLYTSVLARDPRNLVALINVGVIHLERGALEEGVRMLEQALEISPEDETVRGNLRNAYAAINNQALSVDDKLTAIDAARKLMALGMLGPTARSNLDALLAYETVPGVLADYQADCTPEELGRTILIACMPKSGSSWLFNAMLKVTGFPSAFLCNAYVENDQELYAPTVAHWARNDKVVHQHCRASAPTIHLIQAYRMHPVVLVRNLADTLVSMRDFWEAGAVRNSFLYGDWASLDQETKHDALIRHLGPWYVQFYVSWKLAETKGDLAPYWVRYEDMIADKPGTLRSIAAWCDIPASDTAIGQAVAATDGDRAKSRFNKGVAGRGAETFTPAQFETLRDLTRPFPSVDFSAIGL